MVCARLMHKENDDDDDDNGIAANVGQFLLSSVEEWKIQLS